MTPPWTTEKIVDPRDLLEVLRQQPLTSPFRLACYSEQHGRLGLQHAVQTVCQTTAGPERCTPDCYRGWEDIVSRSLLTSQPVVAACPRGFLCLSIPLPGKRDLPSCLIAGGIAQQQALSVPSIAGPRVIGADEPPVAPPDAEMGLSLAEAESIAAEIAASLPHLMERQVPAVSLNRTTQRLEAVQKLCRDIGTCADGDEAIALISEALVVLFNLPKVMIVFQQSDRSLSVHSTLGLKQGTFQLDQERFISHLAEGPAHPVVVTDDDLPDFFPGLETGPATVFPIDGDSHRQGLVVVFDVLLHRRDQALIELLINRLATRLESLKTTAKHRLERQFSTRMVAMISALSLVSSRTELYRKILDMSAELLAATSGSLMLLEAADGTLKIEAAKGMAGSLAKTMSVAYGEGIAGHVAKSGSPMLVIDIENDQRVAARNRPRFKTKSFISLPLETEERLIGVLNLADKENGACFTEADLNLIKTFTGHAVLMIDRVATLENADKFEQLAITDPLTGLYNRRFLETRLQEEFSRSERQHLQFCILMADLDNFKIYNDLCGHIAGDKTLTRVAELMRRAAREMDIVARYGGEEFCIILPATGKRESVLVGERLRRAIEADFFPGENHLPLGRLTTSIGIAAYPTDGNQITDIIHAADVALYQAKTLGRNRLVLYEPSFEKSALSTAQS